MKFRVCYKHENKTYAIGVVEAVCVHEAAGKIATWRDVFGKQLDLDKLFVQACSNAEFDRIKALIEKRNEFIINN